MQYQIYFQYSPYITSLGARVVRRISRVRQVRQTIECTGWTATNPGCRESPDGPSHAE